MKKGKEIEVEMGFKGLDEIIGELKNSKLIVVSSSKGMGKTSFIFSILMNIVRKENIPTLLFSLENSKDECLKRFISSISMVKINKIKNGNMDIEEFKKVNEVKEELSKLPLYIDDTSSISINDIREKCLRFKNEKDIGLVVIDYLQLIQQNEDDNISSSLKELSRELNVPILITSQLSNGPKERFEKGENPRPILDDLDSEVVKNSDIIMFVYRDEYYYKNTDELCIGEIIISKNVNGKLGIEKLIWLEDYLKFIKLK